MPEWVAGIFGQPRPRRVALGAAPEGLGALRPTLGQRGSGDVAGPGGTVRTEEDVTQMKGRGRLQEILPVEKPR